MVGWVFGSEDGVIQVESETGGDSYAHKVLMEDRESSGNHGDMNVMKVWDRGVVPWKVAVFAWNLLQNRLPTKENLRRGVNE